MDDLKVLIVDDELGMRMGARKALKRHRIQVPDLGTDVGLVIDMAEDGAQTFAMLDEQPYDLMLLDYKLPDISGLDILARFKERDIDMLVIMVTAYASLEVAVSATKNGAFDFLAKPFTPDELKGVVDKTARTLLVRRQARRLAEEKRQVRFQFLSVLSHELKAPLAAIEGYLNIMRDHTAGDDLHSYDYMVNRALVRIDGMRKLIFDMLDLTRIESGQKQRDIVLLNLTRQARDSIESVQPQADQRGITIVLHASDEFPMTADMSEIEIIFNNLFTNAVKYNRDNGRVDIWLERDAENTVILKVRDTGIGMSKEETPKLFGEFVRIKNEKTRNISGSGLGLSTMKKLALLYEGDVKVESEPDVGTTFTVYLKDAPLDKSGC